MAFLIVRKRRRAPPPPAIAPLPAVLPRPVLTDLASRVAAGELRLCQAGAGERLARSYRACGFDQPPGTPREQAARLVARRSYIAALRAVPLGLSAVLVAGCLPSRKQQRVDGAALARALDHLLLHYRGGRPGIHRPGLPFKAGFSAAQDQQHDREQVGGEGGVEGQREAEGTAPGTPGVA